MIAAFFDVDGTLYTAHMWRGLLRYARMHHRGMNARLYYATLMPLYLLRKLKLISEEQFRTPWVMRMGWLVRGWTAEQADAAFNWLAHEYIQPSARSDVIACLREHVAAGHAVILVSAMLAPVLAKLGKALGAAGTVGTQIELKDGRYTGRVIPPACMGTEKKLLTTQFLQTQGLGVDLAASYAYADSISDRALLEMVGHPVAVYPDQQLAALARDKGWRIFSHNGKE